MATEKERSEKVWKKIAEEIMGSAITGEAMPAFIQRMEAAGFVVNFVLPTGREGLTDREFCEQVIECMNAATGTRFSKKYPSAISTLILARRREGFTLSDMRTVIEKKAKQWLGTPFANILTFEHLFDKSHFINYLGQLAVAPNERKKETVAGAAEQLKKPLPGPGKN